MRSIGPSSPVSIVSGVNRYLENALSENTRRAYGNDLRHFAAWGGSLPADPEAVAAYLGDNASALSIATLQRRLVSIAKAHKMQGWPNPVATEIVTLTMRGIRRLHGIPQRQVAALLKDDLLVMLSHTGDTLKGKRDRALLLLGFCAALRRSELAAVCVQDIQLSVQGITLTIPRSKTDQSGKGRKIGVVRGRGRICPVESVTDWILHGGADIGPMFRPITKGGVIGESALSGRAVADIIKYYAQRSGFDATRYSGHSLRSGLATSAAQHGVASYKIRAQTGHKSDTMLARYIRDGDLFSNNASALF